VFQVAPNAPSQPATTECAASSQVSYTAKTYAADKKHGRTYQVFSLNNTAVMQDIYNYGPVVATYAV
jgi:hypothetical protein